MPALFPTLLGQSIEITRTATWAGGSNVIGSVSGKETSIAYWANPKWEWTLKFDFLRKGTRYGVNRTEMQDLIGFFNLRRGQFEDFLFTDPDDNSVTAQGLGAIAGASIQLVRTFGGDTEPVLAPNVVSNVLDNGVPVNPIDYSVSVWGDANPGVLTFNVAPVPGHAITADITYYWPVRFSDNEMSLDKFLHQLYASKGVKMISKK